MASVPELARVRLALGGKGLAQLVALLGLEIGAQQQVMRHAREAGHSAMARVEGGLHAGKREGAALGDLVRPLQGGAAQLGIRHDAVRSEERRVGKECRSRWSPY